MAIKISGTTVIDNNRNINAGIGTFNQIDVPPSPLIFNPTNGATGVIVSTNIVITFNQQPVKGTGNITLRSGSATGTILQTIGVNSTSVTISGAQVTIDPPSVLPPSTNVFVVVDAGAFIGISFNNIINTYNFTTSSFALSSITPGNSATNVGLGTNITLQFTQVPTRGTGTITLRQDSASGTILESFDAASSGRISINGNNWILDPTSNLPLNKSIHTVIPSTAISAYAGLNTTGAETHSFTSTNGLGSFLEGGTIICVSSPIRWVGSTEAAEVSRQWYSRADAVSRAQQVSGCSGWFVPSSNQLQNPGFVCRTYWNAIKSGLYWANQSGPHSRVYAVGMSNGSAHSLAIAHTVQCARAFRCVTY